MNVRPERSNRAPLPGPEAPSPAEGPAGVDSAGLRRRFNRGGEVTPEERNARLLDAILRNLNVVSGPNERGEYIAWCPFHPDGQGKPPHQPNLHINPERGFICYACGAKGSIPTLARRLGIVEGVGTGQPDVVYPYRDEEGTVVFEVVRFPGKRFRQRRPDGNGGLIWNIKGVRRVLYRLPELLAADPSALVFIAEGENDADRLVQEGLLATTNPGGAGKWRPEFNEAFRGRDVVILADNDDPGREHAEKVAQALHGIARRVRVVEFPDLAPHGDVSDFLGRHSKQDLLARAEKTADWTPAAGENGEAAPHAQRAPYDLVRTVCIGQRAVRDSYPKPEFAIDGIMREKRVHELTAPFKTGKTNLACQTIVAMATGRKFLGRSVKRPYRVAIL
ncbi:MAG: AAA family ATPase, partial [Planctomycetes bacterium]|nr:AAA family ATPase [Planctomycetota bacterium]